MPGFDGGTAISMVFSAKTVGSAAAPAATTVSMFVVLADAKTSAGAPEVIWLTRAELPAKLKVTFTPGWAASNCWPRVVNDSVSEAAASTVRSPEIDGEAEADEPVAAPGARARVVGPAPAPGRDRRDPPA